MYYVMSKETFTSVKDRVEPDENLSTPSAEDLKAQFDAPAFDGVRPNGERVQPLDDESSWIEAHTYVEDKYRLTSEDLVESRMVINPHATQETYNAAGTSHQVIGDEQKPTSSYVKDGITYEVYNSESTEEQTAGAETESPVRFARLRRFLGRKALGRFGDRALGFLNRGAYAAQTAVPTLTEKERAIRHKESLQAKEGDSRYTRFKKMIGRNALRTTGITVAVAAASTYGLYRLTGMDGFVPHRTVNMDINNAAAVTNSIQTGEVVHALEPRTYVFGGHTQGLAHESGFVQSLSDARVTQPGENVIGKDWSAQMGMPGENITMVQSDIEGGQQVADAINDAGGQPVKFVFFSQSTEAGLRGLNEAAAMNGGKVPGNVEVVLIGGPSGDLGLGKNQNISLARPFLDAAGLEINQPIPPGAKITVRTDIADVFGNGGNQSLWTLGTMAIGPGHQVVGPGNGVLISSYEKDGINYEIWGDPQGVNHPITRALRNAGVPITPQAEELANAAAPITMPGQPTQYPDGPNVVRKAGAAADSYIPNSNGAATAAADKAMENPLLNNVATQIGGLPKSVDELSRIGQQDPLTAMNTIGNFTKDLQNTVASFGNILQNPQGAINGGIDAANAAIHQAGAPMVTLPHLQEAAPVAPAAPAPAPVAPNIAPQFQEAQQNLQNFMGNLQKAFSGAR